IMGRTPSFRCETRARPGWAGWFWVPACARPGLAGPNGWIGWIFRWRAVPERKLSGLRKRWDRRGRSHAYPSATQASGQRRGLRISAFLSPQSHTRSPAKAGETGRNGGPVLNAAVQKRDDLDQLGMLADELRLRLAAQAAGAASFHWDVRAGTIAW